MICEHCHGPVAPKDIYGGMHCLNCGTVGGVTEERWVVNFIIGGRLFQSAERMTEAQAMVLRDDVKQALGPNACVGIFVP